MHDKYFAAYTTKYGRISICSNFEMQSILNKFSVEADILTAMCERVGQPSVRGLVLFEDLPITQEKELVKPAVPDWQVQANKESTHERSI